MEPVAVNMKPTRTSFSARATRTNLSYFSYRTGITSIKAERSIPKIVMKSVNPERPAMRNDESMNVMKYEGSCGRTWPYTPFRLKCSDTGETRHSEKIKEYLGDMENYSWF